MGFVGNDEVEEADVEGLVDLHHGGVCGQVDTVLAILIRARRHEGPRFTGQECLKGVVGLFAELAAIAEEKDATGPLGSDESLAQGDGYPRLASAGGLDDECLTAAVREPFQDFLNSLQLIEPFDDVWIWAEVLHIE